VPIHKYSKIKNSALINKKFTRSYSSTSNGKESNDLNVAKKYEDVFAMKKDILKENKGKSGIYMLTNKITKDSYIGQSTDLKKRFTNYFNISYLKSKNNLRISRALIKYGYSNFSLSILEYCDEAPAPQRAADLLKREQYYFDKLNPQYNILKIAGSSLSYKHSEETKLKISKKLKGIYVKEKSALYGRCHTEETKNIMSLKKIGENNNMYGKIHTEKTKELMRLKALGRKHSEETKLKMSVVRGNLVHVYEKCDSEGFKLIGSFVSIRRAAKFLEISASTIKRYINSGEIFKYRYKFSSESL
jgi:group I intron endonuclease